MFSLGFVILASMACIGIHLLTERGYPLSFLTTAYEALDGKKGIYWLLKQPLKPLGVCARCTASVWGLTFYYAAHNRFSWDLLIILPAIVFLNSLFVNLYYKTCS